MTRNGTKTRALPMPCIVLVIPQNPDTSETRTLFVSLPFFDRFRLYLRHRMRILIYLCWRNRTKTRALPMPYIVLVIPQNLDASIYVFIYMSIYARIYLLLWWRNGTKTRALPMPCIVLAIPQHPDTSEKRNIVLSRFGFIDRFRACYVGCIASSHIYMYTYMLIYAGIYTYIYMCDDAMEPRHERFRCLVLF